jgi:histidine triad (HIT) family protein
VTEPTAPNLRARSCPTCHSIGEPRTVDRTLGGNEPIPCRDPWHQPDQPTTAQPGPDGCVFCRIVAEVEPATIVRRWTDAIAVRPLSPVADGHLLVIPRQHVVDATEAPYVTAGTMLRAASVAAPPCNIITSAGPEATQTVQHLHIHVVPRRAGDGLALPWTGRSEPTAQPRYMPISRLADGEAKRTVQASETVNVDVAPDGRILGIECLTGPANTAATMFVALQALRVVAP